jgi:ABC-type glycerol-3-phosphate transport system substrate-binding protein
MKRDFEWTFAEDEMEPETTSASGRVRGPFWFMATAVFLVLILLAGWIIGQRRLAQAEAELAEQVTVTLNELRTAQANVDFDRFMALLDRDPGWRAAQLAPHWRKWYNNDLTVTRAQPHGAFIQANVVWAENGRIHNRLLFFRDERGLPRLSTPDPAYWGPLQQQTYDWGTLHYGEIDAAWAAAIADSVTGALAHFCQAPCPNLTIRLQPHWEETAVPHTIHIPSPRLVALDEHGQPASLFWELLENRLADRVAPTTIRFAVPETAVPMDYERIAADFMAQQPRIQVEIIRLPNPQFDGAAQTPALAQLQAGQIFDLIPFVHSDPAYDTLDYYPQIWAGVWWQERVWMQPQAAQMRLLFYDREAYADRGMAEPRSPWTWEELVADLTQLAGADQWGLLDPGADLLLAYAYDQAGCNGRFTPQLTADDCARPLSAADVNATWNWYLDLVAVPGLLVTPLDTPQVGREAILNNWQSARRQAAIWVDEPVNYEHRLLLAPLGVVGFPGSDWFDGVTPLWVMGNYISAESKRPYSTWQWLTYLDQQPPNRPRRLIPARPSVAHATNYWINLPPLLGRVMRGAFSFAQPVHFEEQQLFTPEEITAVLTRDP